MARGDYCAVVAVLEEMLRRKITAVGSDEAAVAKWLTKTAKRAASKFSEDHRGLSSAELAEQGRQGGTASGAARRKLDLGREKKDGTAQSNLESTTRSYKDKLDRMRSGRRLAGI